MIDMNKLDDLLERGVTAVESIAKDMAWVRQQIEEAMKEHEDKEND